MKIIKCQKDINLETSLKDKKVFLPSIIKLIYKICENDSLFKSKELERIKKQKKNKSSIIEKNQTVINKLIEMQNEITKKLKVLDIENTSKIEDLIFKLGGE